jgi:hypothetical protein
MNREENDLRRRPIERGPAASYAAVLAARIPVRRIVFGRSAADGENFRRRSCSFPR